MLTLSRPAVAVALLLGTLQASASGPSIPEAVRTWAMYEAMFDVCTNSGELENAGEAKQRVIMRMSVEVSLLSNRLHDPLRHRLEIVVYDNALKQYQNSPIFKIQQMEQRGGPCDYGMLSHIHDHWGPVKSVFEGLVSK